MKSVIIALLLSGFSALLGCKKNKQGKSEYPFVFLHHTINKTFENEHVQLRFDEVVSDSRCPTNAFCFWEGRAIGKFTFTRNGNTHLLTLATLPVNVTYSKDTTVDGYKIEFVELRPHPVAGQDPHHRKINAEMKILKL